MLGLPGCWVLEVSCKAVSMLVAFITLRILTALYSCIYAAIKLFKGLEHWML